MTVIMRVCTHLMFVANSAEMWLSSGVFGRWGRAPWLPFESEQKLMKREWRNYKKKVQRLKYFCYIYSTHGAPFHTSKYATGPL